jgi:ABC-type Na+ transport system ATPase subunit NatA
MIITRVLIVGLGSIGKKHLNIVNRLLPNAVLGIKLHEESKTTFSSNIKNFLSTNQMLEFQPNISILTNPAPFHIQTALKLAEINSHIFVEKPLSVMANQVSNLISICQIKNLILQVGYNLRFSLSLQKFNEIVDFAEIEKFLDTPVKRYSSGMYVRLAFAVAANLESDILIVDEVLAVGDAAFQKKCLGKMNEVSKADGRTILFVSHNMGQVASLCNTGILLNKGRVEEQGSINSIINRYYNENSLNATVLFNFEDNSLKDLYVKSISICNQLNLATLNFAHNEPIIINIEVKTNNILNDVILGVIVYDSSEKRIFTTQLPITDKVKRTESTIFKLKIPDTFLIPNSYHFTIGIHIPNIQVIDELLNIGKFDVFDNGSEFYKYQNSDVGVVFSNCNWSY